MTRTKRTQPRQPPDFSESVAITFMRDVYRANVEKLAHELRPRFEAGTFRGWREQDGVVTTRKGYVPPLWRLEREIGRRFIGDSLLTAYLILAASPSEPEAFDEGQTDPRYHAAEAMAHDVIRYARAAGWTRGRDVEPLAKPTGKRKDSSFSRWGWSDENRMAS